MLALISLLIFINLVSTNLGVFWRIAIIIGLIMGMRLLKLHSHSIMQIEKASSKSRYKKYNPLKKLIITLVTIFTILFTKNIFLACLIIALVILLSISDKNTHTLLNMLRGPVAFLSLSAISILVEITEKPLDYMDFKLFSFYLSITRKGQLDAISLFLVASSSVTILIFMSMTTPMAGIIASMRKIKTPEVLIELMYLIYRYLFNLNLRLERLKVSAKSRLSENSRKSQMKASYMIAGSVFVSSIKKALVSSKAMESRNYDGEIRFIQTKYTDINNMLMLIYFLIIIAIGVIVWI